MSHVFRQEWFAVRRSRSILLFFVIAIAIALLAAVPSVPSYRVSGMTGFDAFIRALTDSPYAALMGSILAGLYFGAGFQQRTIHLSITAGLSRVAVFVSKTVLFLSLAVSAVLLYSICRGVSAAVVNGWGRVPLAQVVWVAAIGVSMYMLIFSVFVFIAFRVRDTGKTIGISILVYLAYSMLYTMVTPGLLLFAEVSPAVVFDRIAEYNLSAAKGSVAAIAAVIGAVAMAGVTYVRFRKSDL